MTTSRRSQRGLTLIEAVVASGVVAMAAGAVAPSLHSVKARQQLIGAAGEFETDVHFARSTAVASNRTLRLAIGEKAGQSAACYVLFAGAAGDCSCGDGGVPICRDGVQPLRSAHFGGKSGLTVNSNVRSIVFDPVSGTSTPAGTVRFIAGDGRALHQVINIMGRVRTCSPAPALTGFKAC